MLLLGTLPVLILLGFLVISHDWGGLVIPLLVIVFIIYLYQNTYYTVNGNTLNVRSGFMVNTNIDIGKIKSVAETDSILSAPALSMDRIEIFYNTFDSVIISPPDKVQFIADLRAINPDINVSLKNKK